tara:strand:+ start:3743 stop:4516 length:774 start_codon:yes stop_codon:yes gene_type:complete
MSKWVPLTRTDHSDSHWKPRDGFHFASAQLYVSISTIELNKLLPHYVLGFIEVGERFEAVALLGIGGKQNLYINSDGKWLGGYTPAALRGYPFVLAENGDNGKILCIEESHLSTNVDDNPVFDADGEVGEETGKMFEFLTHCVEQQIKTRSAVKSLAEAGLIEEWPIKVRIESRENEIELKGFFRINESALNQLKAEKVGHLRNYGALPLAYAQLFSMSQLEQLAQRAKFIGEQLNEANVNIDFLSQDEGVINFDGI